MTKRPDMVELSVEGMDCNNCAQSITRYLERKGLRDVFVNFQTREVRFRYDDAVLRDHDVVRGINKLGFSVVGNNLDDTLGADAGVGGIAGADHATRSRRRLWFCAALTLPLLLNHFLMVAGAGITILENGWAQLALTLPVYLVGGLHFGRSAWSGLRQRMLNMDVLIFLGATAAFVYSLVGLYWQDPNYYFFETAATIITLVLVGNWLEARAVERTTTAIGALSELREETARRVMPSGAVVTLPVEEVGIGDVLQVNTGDRVPLDGVLLDSGLTVNEALLTGESLSVDKRPGDRVLGGSTVVSGNGQFRVTAAYRDGTLAQIIELVKTAQADKPDLQRLADRISAIFVPVVIVIALLTFLIGWGTGYATATQALMNAIAVLLISCPCAMGLATPTAVMVGVGRLARMGVLIRGGSTVEKLAGIKRLVFDKTGTLTTGDIQIESVTTLDGKPVTDDILRLIYQLENRSSHPIAVAIRQHVENLNLIPTGDSKLAVTEIPGQGLTATDEAGHRYNFGKPSPSRSSTGLAQRAHPNDPDLVLTRNDEPIAHLTLSDTVRPTAVAALETLRQAGLETVLLTGDSERKAQQVATHLAITDVLADRRPAEKLATIERLSAERPTAMVGDGINDAAALSRADLGISLHGASAVALDAAQVVLMRPDLELLPRAKHVADLTLRTIRESLFWAFSYNIVAIPLAALGYLNPMWAALFMMFSDVVVIGNAVRLRGRDARTLRSEM